MGRAEQDIAPARSSPKAHLHVGWGMRRVKANDRDHHRRPPSPLRPWLRRLVLLPAAVVATFVALFFFAAILALFAAAAAGVVLGGWWLLRKRRSADSEQELEGEYVVVENHRLAETAADAAPEPGPIAGDR